MGLKPAQYIELCVILPCAFVLFSCSRTVVIATMLPRSKSSMFLKKYCRTTLIVRSKRSVFLKYLGLFPEFAENATRYQAKRAFFTNFVSSIKNLELAGKTLNGKLVEKGQVSGTFASEHVGLTSLSKHDIKQINPWEVGNFLSSKTGFEI